MCGDVDGGVGGGGGGGWREQLLPKRNPDVLARLSRRICDATCVSPPVSLSVSSRVSLTRSVSASLHPSPFTLHLTHVLPVPPCERLAHSLISPFHAITHLTHHPLSMKLRKTHNNTHTHTESVNAFWTRDFSVNESHTNTQLYTR